LALGIIGVVLLQRSEGGALGMGGGGGGGGGGLMTGRSAGNLLTRSTWIMAGLFMVTSIVLALMAEGDGQGSFMEQQPQAAPTAPAEPAAPAEPKAPISQ
jgi:preprotein translocase subunit SecG